MAVDHTTRIESFTNEQDAEYWVSTMIGEVENEEYWRYEITKIDGKYRASITTVRQLELPF